MLLDVTSRVAVAEQRDDDGEADGDLGGGHGDHHQTKIWPSSELVTLPGSTVTTCGEGHEGQVHRVEHQLDGHQKITISRCAGSAYAGDADGEEHGARQDRDQIAAQSWRSSVQILRLARITRADDGRSEQQRGHLERAAR